MNRTSSPERHPASSIGFFVALLAATAGSSCALVDMSTLTVTSWSPRESQLTSVSGIVVQVEFSRPVDTILTEQAFSLTADDTPLAGRVVWPDSRTLTFVPDEPLVGYILYEMRVSRQAEDAQGRDLYPKFVHSFTTKTDYVRPKVSQISPADHVSISDTLPPLSVSFTEPMDAASLYAAFSLSPSASGFLTLSPDANTLTFTPTQKLQWQTRYTMTIDESASDRQKNTLGADHISHFYVGTDLDVPSVTSVRSVDASLTLVADDPIDAGITVTSGWESTQGFVVSFSEPVLTTSASAAVQISPAVQYTIQEANTELTTALTYVFPDRLAYGVTYTVSVHTGIQDAQGNRTTGESTYHLVVDGPSTVPPVVTPVAYAGVTEPADPSNNVVLSPYGSITLPPVLSTVTTFFDLYVDLAQGATVDRFSVGQAFSVSTTNGAASVSPFAVQIAPSQTNPPPDGAANEIVVRVWVRITNNSASGQVLIQISPDLKDSGGAALAAEFVMPMNDPD